MQRSWAQRRRLLGDLGPEPEQGSPSAWMLRRNVSQPASQPDTSKANARGSHSKAWDTTAHNQGVSNQSNQETR